jgi:pimeloyl-ACP methyl ester carboxylesterase
MNDGTKVHWEGTLDASLPLVVLLHGMGGDSLDMTDPVRGRPGLAFARNTSYSWYRDEGIHFTPPPLPVARFFADPPLTSLTSWSRALANGGFSTLSYNQTPGALIAQDVAQLTRLVKEVLEVEMELSSSSLRIVFVAHSRGGLVARSFLTTAAADPTLAAFLGRVTALITLHSPHTGSGLANLAATVDVLLVRLIGALASAGIPTPGILTMARTFTSSPAIPELAIGSTVLSGIAAAEPVPGIAYHTFGGNSTAGIRLWASAYTPDSFAPLPVPFPLFHWGSWPAFIGAPLDIVSLLPRAALFPVPIVTELVAVLTTLAATTPEFAPGLGDVLVADARSHLPFSTTRTTNGLNHAEALWDPTLQAQVVAILSRLRTTVVSGRAITRITPFPASATPASHTVTAVDAVSGVPVSAGTVVVYDPEGRVAVRGSLGVPFTYGFANRKVRTFNPATRRWEVDILEPTVEAVLPPPYGTVGVAYR